MTRYPSEDRWLDEDVDSEGGVVKPASRISHERMTKSLV
jgi:hypothetical protein